MNRFFLFAEQIKDLELALDKAVVHEWIANEFTTIWDVDEINPDLASIICPRIHPNVDGWQFTTCTILNKLYKLNFLVANNALKAAYIVIVPYCLIVRNPNSVSQGVGLKDLNN